jgi:broad specificity phosphatase PhoE
VEHASNGSRNESRLLLIRHGRSAHADRWGWVDAAGVRRWLEAYDAAGISPADLPPPALARLTAKAEFLVSSDVERAIASAERLADGRPVLHSPLLREAPVDVPALPVRLPLGLWAACIHLRWGYGVFRGQEPPREEQRRATAAAKWLGRLAREGSPIVVVTHGVFRRLLADRLLASGWERDGLHRSYRHWSAWSFRAGSNGSS